MVNSLEDNFYNEFVSAFDNRIIHYENQLKELEKMNHKINDRLQIIQISIILISIIFLYLVVLH